MINVFQPSLGKEEWNALWPVIQSNWTGRGKMTEQFESLFAGHLGVSSKNVMSIGCCTEGLFQSIELLGIGEGDEVVLPSISFVGAANAIAHHHAVPVFCDVDRRTLNASLKDIESKITPRTKAVMVLQYGGVPPAEMGDIAELCRSRGLFLIEDCACGVSSRYRGRACGTWGDVGIWSFDSMKIVLAGDGGMMYWKDERLIDLARKNIYLGMSSSSGLSNKVDAKWWEFEVEVYGRRAIMNDLLSAMGVEQLKKLAGFIDRRKKIWETYQRGLSSVIEIIRPPDPSPDLESSYYLYWVQVEDRDGLAHFLKENQIYSTFRYYPLHWVKAYHSAASLPQTEWAATHTLCLPLHQSLSEDDVDYIIDRVKFYVGH